MQKERKIYGLGRVIISLLVTMVVIFGTLIYFDKPFSIVIASAAGVIGLSISVLFYFHARNEIETYYDQAINILRPKEGADLQAFSAESLVVNEKGVIIWRHDLLVRDLQLSHEIFGKRFSEVFPEVKLSEETTGDETVISIGSRYFRVVVTPSQMQVGTAYIVQFVDITVLYAEHLGMEQNRPVVMQISVDNYDEVFQNVKDSDRTRITASVEELFEKLATESSGMLKRLSHDRYMLVTNESALKQMTDTRFPILEEIKDIELTLEYYALTLSIGVGRLDTDFQALDAFANQGLEMAQGRGGDQVAVRDMNGYQFYGGVSPGVEKRTKVKTRVIASAMTDIIKSADNCIVMGHRFADLDSFGAAFGLASGIARLGKDVVVAIDPRTNLVPSLVEKARENGYDNLIVSPEEALETITDKTLLFIVDTHVLQMVESREIFERCGNNIIVIDHHRKMVGHIDNALIFFHEPVASSASEMVTELIQYLDEKHAPTQLESEALLAGIVLDTRSFVLRTGVRTFEAAAFLRRSGANTITVKKLFTNSMEAYQKKAQVVAAAEIYRGCALVATDLVGGEMRIVAPQSADELLTISGVRASFVLYPESKKKTGIQVSARSYGEVNVQVILEKLGGGGHLTMAGATLPTTLSEAKQQIIQAIDAYFDTDTKS